MVRFDAALAINGPPNLGAHIIEATYSNGYKVNYQYELKKYRKRIQTPDGPDFVDVDVYRMKSATSSSGYVTDFTYLVDSPGSNGAAFYRFYAVSSVKQTNSLSSGSTSQTINTSLDSTGQLYTVTDPLGRQSIYRTQSGVYLAGITRPNSSSEDVTITYDSVNRVYSFTNAVGTTTYSYSDAGGVRTTTVTDPAGHATIYTFDIALQRMKSLTTPAPISKTTHWDYDTNGRVIKITAPEGNYTQYIYDGRGNVTEARMVAKSGSGIADIVTTSGYDATCSAAAKCNQPNWTKDAKGNQADYTYDVATGNLLTVTAPAATAGAIRPVVTYSYTTVNGVQMLSGTSTCQAGASCAGTADEIRTSTTYNSNGLPVSMSKGAGNGSLTATTTIGYDDIGNAITVDGPLAGAGDTTRYRFDAARQLVGVVSPDPDGGGSLKPRAQRITYDAKGRVTLVEAGNVNSQSDGDWTGFAPQQQLATEYDGVDHKVKEVLSAAGTSYKVTQYSYDAAGRLDCTALRMNSATWGSLPGACALAATGAAGPDRITRNTYDNADRLTKTQSAYGTADQADEVVAAYTDNGKVASVTDGEGNKTSYEYDGFDRLSKAYYPVATRGAATSSTSDYEQLGYDAASNVTSRRLRDGQSIGYGYDNLNRMTSKVTPGAAPNWDVAYSYDLLGQVINATGDGWAVNALTYDALGRVVAEQTYSATTYHTYDLAGQQTRLTWSDGFYVDYDYNLTGEVTAIRENGATSGAGVLATYGYDGLGRRASIARGNGTGTSYGYDAVSRLSSLTQDLGGGAYDFTNGFTYNPAGQIASLTRSNDAYAWTGHYNVDRPNTINGLNQLTATGATGLAYDGRGNLTTSGSSAFGYTAENQLVSAPGATMLYEPGGGQLLQAYNTSTGADTRFAWSGGQMIAEINGATGTISKRYVPGPGMDEPVVWYEGAGTGGRRWLHADERGSVVAVSDGAGNVIGTNSYDEYGIPGAGNIGRFQYTGQAWLPELGMYYYKARIYSPTLGRFLQADPIGYAAGLNMYSYVIGDPINATDPSGLIHCYTDYYESASTLEGYGGQILARTKCESDPDDYVAPPAQIDLGGGGSGSYQDLPVIAPAVFDKCYGSNISNIAVTPDGITQGNNPKPASGRWNTDLPGDYKYAWGIFHALSRMAGEPSWTYFPPLSFSNATTLALSQPAGKVRLRIGVDMDKGQRIGFSPRVDIQANALQLRVAETIHFDGKRAQTCR